MYNLKEQFINNLVIAEQEDLSRAQLRALELNIRVLSHNIEFTEQCTELSTQTDDNQHILKVFVANKRLENLSDNSIDAYVEAVQKLLMFLNKNYKDVSTDDVKYYLAMYKQTRKVSATTLASMKRFLSAFYGWAYEEGLVRKNPVRAIKGIRPDPVKKEFLTDHEKELLRDNCKNERDLALVDFLLSTGVRVGELETLDIADVDFSKNIVCILGHKTRKYRNVYLSAKAAKHLKDYLEMRTDDNPALFIGVRAPYGRIKKCTYEMILKAIAVRAGVTKHCTVHLFRKTLATTLFRNGCSLAYIAEILGHASTQTTEQCYLTICPEDVQAAFLKHVA